MKAEDYVLFTCKNHYIIAFIVFMYLIIFFLLINVSDLYTKRFIFFNNVIYLFIYKSYFFTVLIVLFIRVVFGLFDIILIS